MRVNGWRGATRAKKVRTTIADPAATRAPDLVNRQFAVEAPNRLLVADFTYVRTSTGFCYTAFVIDAFAGSIVGWECSTSKHTAFVERAIAQAAALRTRQGNLLQNKTIHHSDAGSPSTPRKTSPPCATGSGAPSRWAPSGPAPTTASPNRSTPLSNGKSSKTTTPGPTRPPAVARSSAGWPGTTPADATPGAATSPRTPTKPSTPLRSRQRRNPPPVSTNRG